MAAVTIAYGTRSAYPNVSCLNSVASAAAASIGGVDATATTPANPVGFKVDLAIKLATTGTTSTGTLTVYLLESADGGTTWTDGLNTALSSLASTTIKNARVLAVATANANSQVVQMTFDLPSTFTPKNHTLLILNGSGAVFSASGHVADFTPITYAVA